MARWVERGALVGLALAFLWVWDTEWGFDVEESEGGMEDPLHETLHGGLRERDPIFKKITRPSIADFGDRFLLVLKNVRLLAHNIKQPNVWHLAYLISAIAPATPSMRRFYDDCVFRAPNYPCCSRIVP